MSKFSKELGELIRSRHSVVGVLTAEEERARTEIRTVARDSSREVMTWTLTGGIVGAGEETTHPATALERFVAMAEKDMAKGLLLCMHDLTGIAEDPILARALKDAALALRRTKSSVLIVAPEIVLPLAVREEVVLLELELPGLPELDSILAQILDGVSASTPIALGENGARERVTQALLGMTAQRAADAIALSVVRLGGMSEKNVEVLVEQKEQEIRKGGVAELHRAAEREEGVGGLDVLKDWLRKRARAFTAKARDFGLPSPRGLLLLGVQGCGKSLVCKALSSMWRLPLLRLDVGAILGSLMGQSEAQARQVFALAERVAPCVLWLDEIEKGLAGAGGAGAGDGGTIRRVLGTILTWMQEKEAPVFVVATANDISTLPPELLRKGRFDEIFFVDLPSAEERETILGIHVAKRGRRPEAFDLAAVAAAADGFSGAELEAAVVSGLFEAFDAGRELGTEDLLRAVRGTYPLSRTMAEEIATLRAWARDRAVAASGRPAAPQEREPAGVRAIEV